MKVLIELPRTDYDNFLNKCVVQTPEYALLKNAVIPLEIAGTKQPMITIICEEPEAKYLLLATAEALHVPAIKHVRRALDIFHLL
jgi:hypothetical protein